MNCLSHCLSPIGCGLGWGQSPHAHILAASTIACPSAKHTGTVPDVWGHKIACPSAFPEEHNQVRVTDREPVPVFHDGHR